MQAPRIARTAHERVTDVLTYVDQMLDDGMAEPHELREYHRRKREALATTQAADALSALSMNCPTWRRASLQTRGDRAGRRETCEQKECTPCVI